MMGTLRLGLKILQCRLTSRMLAPEDFGAEYDRVAGSYRRWLDRMARHADNILPDADELADGMNILDLACGTGYLSRAILQRTGARLTLTGVDISEGMLAECRRHRSDPRMRLARADALEFLAAQHGAFDHILCGWGLAYLERRAFFRSAAAALKPGGALRVIANGKDSASVIEPAIRALLSRHPEQLQNYVQFGGRLPADSGQLADWGRAAGLEPYRRGDGEEDVTFLSSDAYLTWQEESGAAAGLRRIFRDYESIRPELAAELRNHVAPDGLLHSRHPYAYAIWRRPL